MKRKKARKLIRGGVGLTGLALLAVLLFSPKKDNLTTRITGEDNRGYEITRLVDTRLVDRNCMAVSGENTSNPRLVYSEGRERSSLNYVDILNSTGRPRQLEERIETSAEAPLGPRRIIATSDGQIIIIGGETGGSINQYIIQAYKIDYNSEQEPSVGSKREIFETDFREGGPLYFDFINGQTYDELKQALGNQMFTGFEYGELPEQIQQRWGGEFPPEITERRQTRESLEREFSQDVEFAFDYGTSSLSIGQYVSRRGIYSFEPPGHRNTEEPSDDYAIMIRGNGEYSIREIRSQGEE